MSDAGAGAAAVTVTLSKIAVFNALSSWLVTARPTRPGPAGNDVLPTEVHDAPSADTAPVTVVPVRVSRSHAAGGCVAPPTKFVIAPADGRPMNSMSFDGRRSRMTSGADDVSELRSMMPAFANVLVSLTKSTRATISPSPSSGRFTNWKWSSVHQM